MSGDQPTEAVAGRATGHPGVADDDLAACQRVERRLLWKELAALGLVAAVVVVRAVWLG